TSATLLLPRAQQLVVVDARGFRATSLVGVKFPISQFDPSLATMRVPPRVEGFAEVVLAPLQLGHELAAVLAVASSTYIPADTEEAVRALAAEIVMALECLAATQRFKALVQNSSDTFSIVD